MEELMSVDLYEFIGADPKATVSEIKKAYRKKALTCHPDKNPDNPKAAELFLKLSKALEILTDEAARAAYDKVVNARLQAKQRTQELNSRRKKFKEDLEARERAAQWPGASTKSDEEKLRAEIERLKKEGSRQVEEEKAYVRRQIFEQMTGKGSMESDEGCFRIKIKWNAAKDDPNNGGYDSETLNRILSKYGDVSALIISGKKKGSALVEYTSRNAAEDAVQYEIGLMTNPLILERLWISNKPTNVNRKSTDDTDKTSTLSQSRLFPSTIGGNVPSPVFHSFSSAPDIFTKNRPTPPVSDADFENSVLSNMRRAEERKKLIEQMKAEEEGT